MLRWLTFRTEAREMIVKDFKTEARYNIVATCIVLSIICGIAANVATDFIRSGLAKTSRPALSPAEVPETSEKAVCRCFCRHLDRKLREIQYVNGLVLINEWIEFSKHASECDLCLERIKGFQPGNQPLPLSETFDDCLSFADYYGTDLLGRTA